MPGPNVILRHSTINVRSQAVIFVSDTKILNSRFVDKSYNWAVPIPAFTSPEYCLGWAGPAGLSRGLC
jgi:hypothetical protein